MKIQKVNKREKTIHNQSKGLFRTIILAFIFSFYINMYAQNIRNQSGTIFDGHVVSSDWIDHGVVVGVDFSTLNIGMNYIDIGQGFKKGLN